MNTDLEICREKVNNPQRCRGQVHPLNVNVFSQLMTYKADKVDLHFHDGSFRTPLATDSWILAPHSM